MLLQAATRTLRKRAGRMDIITGSREFYGLIFPQIHFLFAFRTTSFSPDQTSSTAHTLMSTSPMGSATALIVSSVMSVGTLEDFFGHETQIAASGRIFASEERRRAASRDRSAVKRWMMCVSSPT